MTPPTQPPPSLVSASAPSERPAAPGAGRDTGGRAGRGGGWWWKGLAGFAGLAVLLLLLDRVGWRELGASFRRLGWPALAALLALGVLEHLLDCLALQRAMLGRIGLGWTTAANSAGMALNLVVPFEAGEILKAALLRRRSRHSQVMAGLIVWNYVWKVARPASVALGFLGALALGHTYGGERAWPVLLGVAVAFLPYLGLRLLLRQRPAERLMRLLARVPRLERRYREPLQKGIVAAARLDGEVRSFWLHHGRAYLEVFALLGGGRLLMLGSLAIFAHRLGLPADLGSIAFLFAAQSVAEYFGMVLPARVGVGEGTAYLLFQWLGLDPAAALVITITVRARYFLVQAPCALLLWRNATPAGHRHGNGDGDGDLDVGVSR